VLILGNHEIIAAVDTFLNFIGFLAAVTTSLTTLRKLETILLKVVLKFWADNELSTAVRTCTVNCSISFHLQLLPIDKLNGLPFITMIAHIIYPVMPTIIPDRFSREHRPF
jgi:hypothetical protein